MKVPLQWLADYVPLSLPPAQLVERLTLAGLEVAGVRVIGLPVPEGVRVRDEDRGPVWDREKIVTAEVVKVDKHPDADRLKLPTVAYGQGRVKTMVTGAPNLSVGDVGQRVILALSGSVLFDGHATPRALKELKPTKIRGVPSDAMVCSAYELGISEEHEGIILLEPDAPVGVPLADFMGDVVLEIDVLPNMSRCLCLLGVAREVAALTGQKLKLPALAVQADGPSIEGLARVRIDDASLSLRYACALLQGIKIGPAPGWMQRRLTYAGMRPINNVVDITNYVMLEWGQPLHAFDYDVLKKRAGGKVPTIIVRPARGGELLRTLDNQERKLTPDMLVIADEAGAIALAGIMGGAETEVTAGTTNVLLESANFDFVNIRRTMKALNLPSEASYRFCRGIHPESVKPALDRAAELMRLHASATVCKGVVDVYPHPAPPRVVELTMAEVRRVLGADLAIDECARLLSALEFKVEKIGNERLKATVPSHRLDIQEGPADLIEDLARLHGYDRLPATLLAEPLPEQSPNIELDFEEQVRDLLIAVGLDEVITYSLTTPEKEAPLLMTASGAAGTATEYVRLVNPISSERVVMRQSVLAGVLEVLAANLRHAEGARLFEIGSIYLPQPGQKLPAEPARLALALSGKRAAEFWGDGANASRPALDFFDLKGMFDSLANGLHLENVTYRSTPWAALHPGRAAEIVVNNKVIGRIGELHPKVAEVYGLAGRTVLVADIDLDLLRDARPTRYSYRPVPRFPAALRDIALVVEECITAERVASEIRAAGGDLLGDVRLFDLYRGENIGAGKKSLAYALSYQADDRTLTDKEVDKAHKKIEDRLKHVLKAQVRGKD